MLQTCSTPEINPIIVLHTAHTNCCSFFKAHHLRMHAAGSVCVARVVLPICCGCVLFCVCVCPAQDIDLLPIGEKSKQKLQEILATGRLRRNDVLESSELHRTLQLFMT